MMGNRKQPDQGNSKDINNASTFADGDDRYRALIDNIPGAVYRCEIDKHWTMEFISAAIETITGFKADDFINNRIRSYSSIIHPDDVDMVDIKVRAAVETKEPFVLYYRIIDAQGKIKWAYEKGSAVYGKDNVPLWLDGVIFDITDQHRARQTVETEYAQLLSIFDSMDEVIYVADPQNYDLLYGNEVFRKNWGDPVGQKCYRALQGRDTPCPFCTNDKIFGENIGKSYIWEFQNEQNQRWYRCIDRAIKWTDGSMVRFEMAIDNHELKMAQIELDAYRERLEKLVEDRTLQLQIAKKQAETANAAKSDFLARMSHEIRTPLNAVTGLTNIVLKSNLTAEQRDYLNKVKQAGGNLLQVINDILDFSKVEAGQLNMERNPFELNQFMEQLADLFDEQVAQKDLELVFTLDANVPRHLMGDGARLAQVLINLIQNAVKFTESGQISVGVEPVEPEVGNRETRELTLKFSVSDTGTGIAANELPTLFEPFTQAEGYLTRKQEGSGLGLAICRRLVELMGGRIWADSTPGRGSTFYFTVMMETQKKEKPRLRLPADLRGLKILVVDDNDVARQVMAHQLESFACNVTSVDSGEKAIKAIEQADQDEPFQVVLLDWKMPGLDGITTAGRIRELAHLKPETANQAPKAPIIIMVTANVHEALHKQIENSAIDTLLLKPIKPYLLFNTIMELLGQADAMVSHRAQEPAAPPVHGLAGRRVMVVEDNVLNLEVAVALLEEAGLTVEAAENGHIAVEKLTASARGHYDAILMDIQMPVMDGYEATRRIKDIEKRQNPNAEQPEANTPIIALTAHALKGEKEKCLAAGMDDYLAKPLDEQDLHQMLLKWIVPHGG